MRKIFVPIILIIWLESILLAFYVVQKPDFLSILPGLWNLILIILIPAWMAILSACMGAYLLMDETPEERLVLGSAIGMGIFGLAGFGFAISGWGKPIIALFFFLILTGYFFYSGKLLQAMNDMQYVVKELKISIEGVARWIPISAGVAIALAFLMSLAPPVEDFDALFYHLTVPAWWLQDAGITLSTTPHYWFPQIVEGSFVWPMVWNVDTATHLIHFTWLILSIILLWHWTRQQWGNLIAWDVLMILLTMPSLLLLSTWSYTDYALTFASLATIYSLWKWNSTQKNNWLLISGIMAGMAVSVKYTGFVVPLSGLLLIVIWGQGSRHRVKKTLYFSTITVLAASPWYLRNWIWMKNPIYPFIFGGRFWDSFSDQAFSLSGSGIGADIVKLLTLPLTATLGTQDMNFFDGRIGPFFLILLPVTLCVYRETYQQKNRSWRALFAIGLFSIISMAAWILGAVNSASLFQTRLLYPALFPAVIPLALGLNFLYKLDTSQLRISLIVRSILAITVIINLINFSLQTLLRNPLSVAIGITSRQEYIRQRQPQYAEMVALVNRLSGKSRVLFLFEPRSYGVTIRVEPDAINSHFSHDIWLYATPEKVITSWKDAGYTDVLIRNFRNDSPSNSEENEFLLFNQTENLMIKIGETPQGDYALYKIP